MLGDVERYYTADCSVIPLSVSEGPVSVVSQIPLNQYHFLDAQDRAYESGLGITPWDR